MTDFRPPKGFLRGINPRYFLDTYGEWHALVQGFCEVLCPWPPLHRNMNETLKKEIEDEHHYYMFGRALGILGWLAIGCVIKGVFF